jgi:hypothetical protein
MDKIVGMNTPHQTLWRLALDYVMAQKKLVNAKSKMSLHLFFEPVQPYMQGITGVENMEEGLNKARKALVQESASIAETIMAGRRVEVERSIREIMLLTKKLQEVTERIEQLDADAYSEFAACTVYYELITFFDFDPSLTRLLNFKPVEV